MSSLLVPELPGPERVRHLADGGGRGARGQQIDQQLEAGTRQAHGTTERKKRALTMKNPLIASLTSVWQTSLLTRGPDIAQAYAAGGELAHAAAFDAPASDDDVQRVAFDAPKHRGQHRLVVLQVRVHDGEVRRMRSHHALDAGRRQATPADTLEHAHARIGQRDGAEEVSGTVRRVVVDVQDLPLEASQSGLQTVEQKQDIFALVVGRDDDRQLQRRTLR